MTAMKKTRLTFNEREVEILHRAILEELVRENDLLVKAEFSERENHIDNTRSCLSIIAKIGEAERRML